MGKVIRISNVPVRLSMTIILIFGLIPIIGFSIYHYLSISRTAAQGEKQQFEELQQELKINIDSEISLLNSFMAMGEKQMKQYVKSTSVSICDVVERMYHQHEKRCPHSEIVELIRDHIRGIRLFNGRGYFFAYSLDGILQVYPPDLAHEGSTWLDIEDSNGQKPVREMIQVAKSSGEGFVEYTWPLPGKTDKGTKKVSYVKYFKPLGWVMGTGDYLEASAQEIKSHLTEAARQNNLAGEEEWFLFDPYMNQISGQSHENTRGAKDSRLKEILVQMKDQLQKGDGEEIRYSRPGKNGGSLQSMIGYVQYYKPWGWIIGKGVNSETIKLRTEKLRQEVKQEVIHDFILMIFVQLLAVSCVFLIGQIYATRLKKNLAEFETFFRKAGKKREQIDLNQVRFYELKSLAEMANTMVDERETTQRAIQKLNRKLKQMADIDGLTQVFNRRFFDMLIQREWNRAARAGYPITLGMLDIDFFKRYNDTYGHQMGDDCLISVASALKKAIKRPADFVARYGGEEFVILLVNTDLPGGQKVAASIQKNIEKLAIRHSGSPLGRVSISMGLAWTVPEKDKDASTLIRQADQALYRAKEMGRDRIESATADCLR
jgi:diguanylate cyclase (GGDEF)-like protein